MSNTSTHKAVSVALLAAKANKALFAQPNTPLEVLTRQAFCSQLSFDYLADQSEDNLLGGVTAALGIVDGDEITDLNMVAFTESLTQAVNKHTDYARNVVLPELKDLVKIVSERMVEPKSIVSDFKIDVVDMPAVMANAGFKSRIEQYQGGTYANPSLKLNLPIPEDVREALKTGSNDFDESINQWVDSIGQDKLAQMWMDVYTEQGRAAHLIEFFEGVGGIDYAIFVWLTLNRLLEDTPEGISYTLQDLQRHAGQYLEAAAIRIQKEYNVDERFNAAQMLVLGVNKYNNAITVNGPVYRDFIAAGGRNETLLGGMITDKLGKTLTQVQADADEHYAEYERSEALAQSLRRNNAFNEFKSALIWGMSALQYGNLSEPEKEAWSQMHINITTILNKAQEIVDNLTIADMKDVHATCMKVLCGSRYYYTDALEFLTSMDNAMKDNPNMDVREAGLIATFEKIGDYLADQIVVRSI